MKPTLLGLCVLLLVSPAEGRSSTSISTQQLSPYVTQLGKTHFPAGGAAQSEYGSAIVALRSGAVLVAGRTYGSLGEPHAGPSDNPDIFVARFDPLGNVEWVSQIGAITAPTIPSLNGNPGGPGGNADLWDDAADLAVASDGSIYVTGYTSSNLGEATDGGDVFLAKFDAQGALQWLRQLGVQSGATYATSGALLDTSSPDSGRSLLVDPSGAVYVAGFTYGQLGEANGNGKGGTDVFLARFSADGRLEWLRQMGWKSSSRVGFDSHGWESSPKIARHPSGSIVMACSSEYIDFPSIWLYYATLFTFDEHGEPLAARVLRDTIADDVAVDPSSGKVFFAGRMGNAFVASFDVDLEPEWLNEFDAVELLDLGLLGIGQETLGGVCIDAAGDLILAGTTASSLNEKNAGTNPSGDVFTAKMRSSDGKVLWVSQIGKVTSSVHGLGATAGDWVGAVDLGPRGAIVVTGGTVGSLAEPKAGSTDVVVMRLTPDGQL